MAYVLAGVAARGGTLSDWVTTLPRYEIVKDKLTCPRESVTRACDALRKTFTDATAIDGDGLRLDWPDRWVQVRASNTEPILRVIAEDYVRTAHSKGLPGRTVLFRHVLRNAALPIVTTLGMAFGYAITGSFVVEVVFNIPGMARVAVDAILQRDYVVIQTVVLIYVVLFTAISLLVDLSYAVLNPRVRY